ncbi:MAG TPA: 2-oxoglutarate dehydrogenase complex dihydrolipoyllysine-residue succinyltransferase [Polyangiaceae bacterium]
MSVELKVPPVGESITEVQIGEWLKKEGDSASRDEVIVMIETDKVTVELPAPVTGVVTKITVAAGSEAQVGDVIGYMEEGAPAQDPKPSAASAKAQAPAKEAAKKAPPPAAASGAAASGAAAPAADKRPTSPPPPPSDRTSSVRESLPPHAFARVMPSARRVMAERGLKESDVEASGPGGRVLKEDALRAEKSPAAPAPTPADPTRTEPALPLAGRGEEVVKMSPMRRRIAERLVESQQTAALLTTFNEIDMTAVLELRKEHQDDFVKKYEIKLGFMSFFVKAAIEALKLIPQVNAEVRGDSIVYRNYYDIGVAVGGGKGLVVPVIRNAELLSFAQVEQTIAELAGRAKQNKLQLEELQGGTFTISNGGIYGSLLSTPIINPPQSGILGLHAIQERPVALKGQVVIRPMMYVALTYDHRIVDGREAVTFLKRIKECVEAPQRILLEV